MREIRFRAWDTFNNRMVMDPYRFEVNHDAKNEDERFNTPFIYHEDWQDIDDGISRPCHIMQFTGLKDKNGKEIYEGDIVKTVTDKDMVISWSDKFASFVIMREGWMFQHWFGEACDPKDCEVIGNIYEHPEHISPAG